MTGSESAVPTDDPILRRITRALGAEAVEALAAGLLPAISGRSSSTCSRVAGGRAHRSRGGAGRP